MLFLKKCKLIFGSKSGSSPINLLNQRKHASLSSGETPCSAKQTQICFAYDEHNDYYYELHKPHKLFVKINNLFSAQP